VKRDKQYWLWRYIRQNIILLSNTFCSLGGATAAIDLPTIPGDDKTTSPQHTFPILQTHITTAKQGKRKYFKKYCCCSVYYKKQMYPLKIIF